MRHPSTGTGSYQLDDFDRQIVESTRILLQQLVRSGRAQPAQLVSIAKALHAFERLPRPSAVQTVSITVTGPTRRHGDIETYFYWEIALNEGAIEVGSGGYYDAPPAGGDSFTIFHWSAAPGRNHAAYLDYTSQLSMVPDLVDYHEAVARIDFQQPGYSVEVHDPDNVLLDERDNDTGEESLTVGDADGAAPNDDDGMPAAWDVIATGEAEIALLNEIALFEVDRYEAQFADGMDDCGECGCALADRGIAIDGRLRDSFMWGNFCAACYARVGSGIGVGHGQVYARQPNGDWRQIAGFSEPDEFS
ncbi:hypothetical protein E4K72_15215 [Oxalobacteraceae bacterium OM1]|nr:hypothetical protein E4K72_15215 [Oxalobacteraceae bacterium OM1]